MTEPLRRVKIEAEVDEDVAASLERAIASGAFESVGAVLEAGVAELEHARQRREDPEGWAADAAELHRRIDALEADPSRGIPIEVSEARVLARLALLSEAAE